MKTIKKAKLLLFNLPKTLYFNLKYLPLKKAIKLPIFISRNVLLNKLRGSIEINGEIETGMILIGFGDVPIFDKRKSRTIWNNGGGKITFNGNCRIGHGSKIAVGGELVLGKNFGITAESSIICDNYIEFGDDVLISWKCQIMDTDFHNLIINGNKQFNKGTIIVGNKVWIGMNVIVLKNSKICDNSVIAAGSIINKQFNDKNILIAGVPGKTIRNNIQWQK